MSKHFTLLNHVNENINGYDLFHWECTFCDIYPKIYFWRVIYIIPIKRYLQLYENKFVLLKISLCVSNRWLSDHDIARWHENDRDLRFSVQVLSFFLVQLGNIFVLHECWTLCGDLGNVICICYFLQFCLLRTRSQHFSCHDTQSLKDLKDFSVNKFERCCSLSKKDCS